MKNIIIRVVVTALLGFAQLNYAVNHKIKNESGKEIHIEPMYEGIWGCEVRPTIKGGATNTFWSGVKPKEYVNTEACCDYFNKLQERFQVMPDQSVVFEDRASYECGRVTSLWVVLADDYVIRSNKLIPGEIKDQNMTVHWKVDKNGDLISLNPKVYISEK